MLDARMLDNWPSTSSTNDIKTNAPSCSKPAPPTSPVERSTSYGPRKAGVVDIHYISMRKESRKRYFAVLSERSLDFHESEKTLRKNKRAKHIVDLSAALNVSLQKFGHLSNSWVVLLAPSETFLLRVTDEDEAQMKDWYDKIRATLISARLIKFGRHTSEVEFFTYTWDVRVRSKPRSEHAGALPNICTKRPELANQHYRLCAYADTLLLCQANAVLNADVRSYPPLLEKHFIKFLWGSVNHYGSSNKHFFFRYNQSYEVWLECFAAPYSASTVTRDAFERIRELTESERARLLVLARIGMPMATSERRSHGSSHRRTTRDGRPRNSRTFDKVETSDNYCNVCHARVFIASSSAGSGVDEETEGSGSTLRDSCGYCRQRDEGATAGVGEGKQDNLGRQLKDLDLTSPYVEMTFNGNHSTILHELRGVAGTASAKSVSRINSRASLNAPSEDGTTVSGSGAPNSPLRLIDGRGAAVSSGCPTEECGSENLSTTSSSISANAPHWSGSADISSTASSRLSMPPIPQPNCDPSLSVYHGRTMSCSVARPIVEETTVVPQSPTATASSTFGCENAPSSLGSIVDDDASYSSSAPFLAVPNRCRDDIFSPYNSDSADSSYYSATNSGLPNQRAVSFTSGVTRPSLPPYRNGYPTLSEHENMPSTSSDSRLPPAEKSTTVANIKPSKIGKLLPKRSSILEDDEKIQVIESMIIVEENSRSACDSSKCPIGDEDDGRGRTLSLGNVSWRSFRMLLPKRKNSTNAMIAANPSSRISKNFTSKSDRAIITSSSTSSVPANDVMLASPRVVPSSARARDEARQRRLSWRSVELPPTVYSNKTDYTMTIASTTAVLPCGTISLSSSTAASTHSIVRADSVGSHCGVKIGRVGGFGSVSVAGFPMFEDGHSLNQSELHPVHTINSREVPARCFISEEDSRKLDQLTRSMGERQQSTSALAEKKARAKRRAAARKAKSAENGEKTPDSGSLNGGIGAVATAFGFETIDENNSGRTSPVNIVENGSGHARMTEAATVKARKARVRVAKNTLKASAGIGGALEPAVKIAV